MFFLRVRVPKIFLVEGPFFDVFSKKNVKLKHKYITIFHYLLDGGVEYGGGRLQQRQRYPGPTLQTVLSSLPGSSQIA